MIVGRVLGWLAALVTGLALVAWLVTSLLVLGGPAARALHEADPASEPLARLAKALPSSPLAGTGDEADADGVEDGAAAERADAEGGATEGGSGATEGGDDDEAAGDPESETGSGGETGRGARDAADEDAAGEADERGEGGVGRAAGGDRGDDDPPGDGRAAAREARGGGGGGEGGDVGAPGRDDAPRAGGGDEGPSGGEDATASDVVEAEAPPAVNWPDFEVYERAIAARPLLQTTHFDVRAADADDPLLVAAAERWATEVEAIHDYVGSRAGVRLGEEPVSVLFDRRYEARCPARGLAAPGGEDPYLVVFVDEGTPDVQVRAVLAHEIAHHLFAGEDFVGDGVLTEGLANWAAGDYALAWQGLDSWEEAARRYLSTGGYVSVADERGQTPRAGEDCIARRDRVYNVRAGFVGWLAERHGVELLRAMPAETVTRLEPLSGERQEMRVPDYVSATGHSLTQLERMWLAELGRGG